MAQTLVGGEGLPEPLPQRAAGYAPAGEGRFRLADASAAIPATAGVWTTVEDLARWQHNLEEPRVGGPALAAAMLRPGTGSLVEHGALRTEYASGLMIESLDGETIIDHSGAGGGFQTQAAWFPAHRLHAIVLCNRADASILSRSGDLALAEALDGSPPRILDLGAQARRLAALKVGAPQLPATRAQAVARLLRADEVVHGTAVAAYEEAPSAGELVGSRLRRLPPARYAGQMSRVADSLRAKTAAADRARTPAERLLLALRLGDSDAALLAGARGLGEEAARGLLRRQRQVGRRPSRCATEE